MIFPSHPIQRVYLVLAASSACCSSNAACQAKSVSRPVQTNAVSVTDSLNAYQLSLLRFNLIHLGQKYIQHAIYSDHKLHTSFLSFFNNSVSCRRAYSSVRRHSVRRTARDHVSGRTYLHVLSPSFCPRGVSFSASSWARKHIKLCAHPNSFD